MKANDCPAFPTTFAGEEWQKDQGMGLRDYFAAKAMAAYLVSPATAKEATDNADKCAEWAYLQADAMLKARAK